MKKKTQRTLATAIALLTLLFGSAPYAYADFSAKFFVTQDNVVHPTIRADESSGALVYSVPIVMPPGRNGLQPDVSLVYNSQRENNTNIVGYGWDVSIPYIERLNKSGTETLYADDYFTSSFDGEIIQSASSTDTRNYNPRVSSEDTKQYTFFQDDGAWQAVDKFGTVYTFGSTTAARQDSPSDSTKIYKWMLQEVRDKNGNYIAYTYTKDHGQIYPATITYTGHGTTDGDFEISFGTESRNDNFASYKTAFQVESKYRINQILVKIDNAWVRKYDIAYTTGVNGSRSLLSSVIETGKDKDGGTVALPAISFSYQSGSPSWSIDATWEAPTDFVASNAGGDLGVRFAEINGDGLIDIARAHTSTPSDGTCYKSTYINDGSGWNGGGTSVPECFHAPENGKNDPGTRLGDFDGDGSTDLVQAFQDSASTSEKFYLNRVSDGLGFESHSEWNIPAYFYHWFSGYISSFLVDVNTDGAADFIDVGSVKLFNATTTGWSASSGVYGGVGTQPEDPAGQQFVDVNGDGLIDRLVSAFNSESPFENIKKVQINNGTGFTEISSTTVPIYFYNVIGNDIGVRVADINSDGLMDIIQAYEEQGPTAHYDVYENVSTSTPNWIRNATLSSAIPQIFFTHYNGGYVDGGWRMSDVNGDGLVDFVGTYYYDGSLKVETYINQGTYADILSQVTTAQGGTIDFTYKSSLQYKDSVGKVANKEAPMSIQTIHTITKNDGFSAPTTETRDYSGASYYYNGIEDRFFAGFQIASTTDGLGNQTITYFHTGSSTDSALGEYSDHISKAGKPFRIEKYDPSGNLYEKTINKWENYEQGQGRNFVKLAQSITFSHDGDADHRDKAESYGWNDESRNLSNKTEWGEVTGSDNGTFADVGSDKRTTVFTYATSTDITGLVAQESIKDYSGVTAKDTIHYYDSLSFGNVSEGNETKREEWESGSTYINFEKTYNSYGLVTTELDPRDKATTYTYDWRNLYQATTTNAESHVTERYFDYSSGKVEKLVNPNGREFETVYDGLDRVIAEKIPDPDSPSSLVTQKTITYNDTVGSRRTIETDYLNTATSTENYTYLDGFDRKIQERKEAEDANTYTVRDFMYNASGLLSRESLPYFAANASSTASTTESILYTDYTYDALKRLLTAVNAVGTTTHAYDDWNATTTDALGNNKGFVNDSFGRITAVNETESGSTYHTVYGYNARDNLTKITDSLGNIRNFTYDGLSRLTKSEDLHDSVDTGYASTTYAYDASGNITSKQDSKSQAVTYTYDDINRVLTEDYDGAAGTEISYGYDACPEGVGRLCSATSTDAVADFVYDALGNIATEVKTIDGISYSTSYAHDWQGNPASVTYPDSAALTYAYNDAGLLESIDLYSAYDGTREPIVRSLAYGPTGAVTERVYGNNGVSFYTYDKDELYRLRSMTSLSATSTPFDGTNPVLTIGATDVGKDGADLVGELIDMMGESAVTVGFRYGLILDEDDPYTATTTTMTASSTGAFVVSLLALDPFKDYSYQAFLETSGGAIYYGDRYRVYTADLTMSMPVYKGHQRAWMLRTYDAFGTHASTTVDGLRLKLENHGSTSTPEYSSGYWLSEPWDLSAIDNVENTFIEYCACARNGADVTVKTAITTGTTTPQESDFTVATTTTTIPGITAGDNLLDKYLWLRIELEPNWTATGTPCLCRINLAINNVATTTSAYNALQDLTYTYDAVGNITQIKDISGYGAQKTTIYTYDDLYRLTTASTTLPAPDPYKRTYAYDQLGNITSKSDQGSYTYGETGYANPHAVTDINGTTLTYDNNGNVTAVDSDTYGWNYRDRLTSSTVGGTLTLYGYDYANDRVTKGDGTATTTYTGRLYTASSATTTKHVFDNEGTLLASIEGNGTATTTNFVHTDHLGGTNIVVDEDGDVVQTLDYYPFGSKRIDSGTDISQFEFTGHEHDSESNLIYAKARYLDSDFGKFLSIDPAIINLVADKRKEKILNNPQFQNSYTYAGNNPLILRDEIGESPVLAPILIGGGVGALGGFGGQYLYDVGVNRQNGVSFPQALIPGGSLQNFKENAREIATQYGRSTVEGAVVGAAATYGATVAGISAIGSSIVADAIIDRQFNPGVAVEKGAVSFVTFGILKTLPKVPGRLPGINTNAFYAGAHTQRTLLEEFVGSAFSVSSGLFKNDEYYSNEGSSENTVSQSEKEI